MMSWKKNNDQLCQKEQHVQLQWTRWDKLPVKTGNEFVVRQGEMAMRQGTVGMIYGVGSLRTGRLSRRDAIQVWRGRARGLVSTSANMVLVDMYSKAMSPSSTHSPVK